MHDALDSEGKTPLEIATTSATKNLLLQVKEVFECVQKGYRESVEHCIEEPTFGTGADPRASSLKGNTPLHAAVSKSHQEIVDSLLQSAKGSGHLEELVNAKTRGGGNTALHVAAQRGDMAAVVSLLKHGATFDTRNKSGETAAEISSDQHTREFLNFIQHSFSSVQAGNPDILLRLRSMQSDQFSALANERNFQKTHIVGSCHHSQT
ncbi:ankyrin-2 [Caerostris extrusa]|uniref:Ankyrin-2 n=1 Tax=Caerostris extrusa TaxID=172846 RepID=A0AAV4VKJ7_CAEEX|nr:ankyrin-2 [Caerostris extrusa]